MTRSILFSDNAITLALNAVFISAAVKRLVDLRAGKTLHLYPIDVRASSAIRIEIDIAAIPHPVGIAVFPVAIG